MVPFPRLRVGLVSRSLWFQNRLERNPLLPMWEPEEDIQHLAVLAQCMLDVCRLGYYDCVEWKPDA
jgi:hypothetical protein